MSSRTTSSSVATRILSYDGCQRGRADTTDSVAAIALAAASAAAAAVPSAAARAAAAVQERVQALAAYGVTPSIARQSSSLLALRDAIVKCVIARAPVPVYGGTGNGGSTGTSGASGPSGTSNHGLDAHLNLKDGNGVNGAGGKKRRGSVGSVGSTTGNNPRAGPVMVPAAAFRGFFEEVRLELQWSDSEQWHCRDLTVGKLFLSGLGCVAS